MIRHSIAAATLTVLVGVSACTADEGEWVQLFNGKDLTGWKQHPKADPKSKWEVKDGLIVGSGNASHLFSEGGNYTDFRYRIEAKINDGGNSGQYFRTAFGPGFPKGYEAQINATHRDKVKTGSLYPAGSLGKYRDKITVMDTAPHKPGEFFTQEVICQGDKITIKVNGKTTVEWTDPDGTFKKGHFAIQQHDPGSTVSVRKVEVMELK